MVAPKSANFDCSNPKIAPLGATIRGSFRGISGIPETPSELAHTPTICLGVKNYKELYILWLFLLAKFHTFTFKITFTALKIT